MPGDNKDKNPWGDRSGGGKDRKDRPNPWGGSHRGGSPEPDLDEMLRRMQNGFRGFFPGGSGGESDGNEKRFVLGAVLAVILLWMASGFFIVSPGEHAVIQRFGAWDRTKTAEGLSYHFPFPVETVTKVNVNEIRVMNIGFFERGNRTTAKSVQDIPEESLMLTSDRNIVDLDLVIQWNIKSAEDYLFNIQNQENTIKKVAESAIREAVGQTRMFPVISTGRSGVADRAQTIIQKNLDEYHSGVNVTQVLILQAEVHPDVRGAFQDVQSAKQDAKDVENRANAYREDILPKARGQAIQLLQEAEGYKQSTVARSNGDAERFNSVYEAYLSGKDVTRERIYIETMEEILRNAQKIILDGEGGQSVVPYLPLNEMNKRTGNNNTAPR